MLTSSLLPMLSGMSPAETGYQRIAQTFFNRIVEEFEIDSATLDR